MKILVVHNRYSSRLPSGENVVVDEECTQLRQAGHEVLTWFRSNDEFARASGTTKAANGLRCFYSPRDVAGVAHMIESNRPDLLHVHNTLPVLSPAVILPAVKKRLPVLHTVHNYRMVCAAGTLFRNAKPCGDCRKRRLALPAVVHACYGGSSLASAAAGGSISAHRRTWNHVDRFIAISSQIADFLVEEGVPRARVTVKPNSVRNPGPCPPPGSGWLFVGRLETAKGVQLLLDAWQLLPPDPARTLTIAGDGPLRGVVVNAARSQPTVSYVGLQTQADLDRLFRACAGIIVPSMWAEPFGRVAVESFSYGRPVVATQMGALSKIVDDTVGWRCGANAPALANAIASATPATVMTRGAAARDRYLARYTPEATLEQLIDIYRKAIATGHLPRHHG